VDRERDDVVRTQRGSHYVRVRTQLAPTVAMIIPVHLQAHSTIQARLRNCTLDSIVITSVRKIMYSTRMSATANSLEAIRVRLFLTNKSGVLIGV
jgi:hypothetical protein